MTIIQIKDLFWRVGGSEVEGGHGSSARRGVGREFRVIILIK